MTLGMLQEYLWDLFSITKRAIDALPYTHAIDEPRHLTDLFKILQQTVIELGCENEDINLHEAIAHIPALVRATGSLLASRPPRSRLVPRRVAVLIAAAVGEDRH